MKGFMYGFERNGKALYCFTSMEDVEELYERIEKLEKQVADLHELLTN